MKIEQRIFLGYQYEKKFPEKSKCYIYGPYVDCDFNRNHEVVSEVKQNTELESDSRIFSNFQSAKEFSDKVHGYIYRPYLGEDFNQEYEVIFNVKGDSTIDD